MKRTKIILLLGLALICCENLKAETLFGQDECRRLKGQIFSLSRQVNKLGPGRQKKQLQQDLAGIRDMHEIGCH